MEPRAVEPPSGPRRRPSVGALLVGLLVGVAVVAVVGALLAPWFFRLVEAVAPGHFPFQRVFRRVVMLVALIALIVGVRRAGVRRWSDVGLSRVPGRGRAAWLGAAWGASAIVAVFAAELALGSRTPSIDQLAPGKAAGMLAGAAAIGLVEESVCRGAFYFPFAPLSTAGFLAANATTSALYSVAHFLRGSGHPGAVDAASGFRIWADFPRAVHDHGEAFVGLFLTGALLYLVVARQGHVWGAAGAHGGAVAVLQLLGTATAAVPGKDSLFLVDGLLPGWGLSAVLAIAMAVFALRRANPESAPARAPAPES